MRSIRFSAAVVALTVVSGSAFAQSAASFSAVEGLVCRGFYDQYKAGGGRLERPESAFKTSAIKNGKFTLLAALAKPGASRGWDTADGNTYLNQKETEFTVQPNGSWHFKNPVAGSNYYLTPVASDDPTVKKFTVRYEANEGWAAGEARCTAK